MEQWYCDSCMRQDHIRQNLDNVICGYHSDLPGNDCPTCHESEGMVWFESKVIGQHPCESCPMQDKCCE